MRQKVIREKCVFWSGHHRDRTTEVGGREHLWRVEGSGSVLWMVSHRGFLIIGVEGAKKCFDSRILKNHSKRRSWHYNTLCRTWWGTASRRWRCLQTKEKTQNSLGTCWFYMCHTHTREGWHQGFGPVWCFGQVDFVGKGAVQFLAMFSLRNWQKIQPEIRGKWNETGILAQENVLEMQVWNSSVWWQQKHSWEGGNSLRIKAITRDGEVESNLHRKSQRRRGHERRDTRRSGEQSNRTRQQVREAREMTRSRDRSRDKGMLNQSKGRK